MNNSLLPIVLLLGAKSTENPLHSIPEELSRLKIIFKDHESGLPDFELDYEPYFTHEQLKTKLLEITARSLVWASRPVLAIQSAGCMLNFLG